MRSLRIIAVLLVSLCGASRAWAQADAVTFWNEVTVQAATAGRPGPAGLFDIALVQTAVHDAVQAVEGDYEPYAYADARRRGLGTAAAAVAAASRRTLVLLYPAQQAALDATYDTYVATHGLTGDPALETGEAAAKVLFEQHHRPAVPAEPFFGRTIVGEWRSATPMAVVYAAKIEPFTLREASQFRPEPPMPLTSTQYLREYEEVKRIGAASSHPSAGTEIAHFWSVNYVTQWNEALRDVARRHVARTGDRARLFALAGLSAADAFIAVWECKIHYNYWRPSTAIQQGNQDGNDKTSGDAAWTPLLADPPYPDYVSGANGLTGAYTGALQFFFGRDEVPFTVKTTSPLVANPARHYTRISDVAREVVEARIYLGIHFRSADEEGRRLGNRVAQWTYAKFLRPIRGTGHSQNDGHRDGHRGGPCEEL